MGHPLADDLLASQRGALAVQLAAAQFDLEQAISELTRNGTDATLADQQLSALVVLQRQIGNASPAMLAAIKSDVAAAVTQTQTIILQARAGIGGREADGAALGDLATQAQAKAASFMGDLRQYDGLLKFDSDEQERAYRRREEEYRKRFDAETAKGTPEGALQASGAAYTQSVDLAAHGGSADPVLMQRIDQLAASTASLRAGLIRDGKDVSRFDADLRNDLRAIMISKGKSDAEIDALLAAHSDNPMEAVKAYLSEGDIARLNQATINASSVVTGGVKETSTALATPGLDSVISNLQSAGIVVSEVALGDKPNHGVSAAVATSETLVGLG